MAKTGLWPWPDQHSGQVMVEFGEDQQRFIRKLTVCWNSAEHGAAGLADEGFIELVEAGDEIDHLVDLFLNTAQIKSWAGVIHNPFQPGKVSDDDIGYCLDHVPDQDIADQLRSGRKIDFVPDADLLKLWDNAYLRGEGIDPKRPFGSGLVSRDVRALIDPDKAMKPKAFKARMAQLESQMMLMLLRFVQTATLAPGTYSQDGSGQWVLAETLDIGKGEEIDHETWVYRIVTGQSYETQDYVRTMCAAQHLMWEGRLPGSYADLNASMKLDTFYGVLDHAYSRVECHEAIRLGCELFEEPDLKPLTRMYVRVLNSQSRFDEALAFLKQRKALPENRPNPRDGITPELVFHAEAVLARLGKRVLETGLYLDAFYDNPQQPSPDTEGLAWSWLHDVMCGDSRDQPNELSHLFEHLQAVAAQIKFMRGPSMA